MKVVKISNHLIVDLKVVNGPSKQAVCLIDQQQSSTIIDTAMVEADESAVKISGFIATGWFDGQWWFNTRQSPARMGDLPTKSRLVVDMAVNFVVAGA